MDRPLPGQGARLGRAQHTGTLHGTLNAEQPQLSSWSPQSRTWTNKQLLLGRSVTLGFTLCGLLPAGLPEVPLHPGPWAPISTHHPSSP